MDWNQTFVIIVQLGIFSVFITSIIEVIKGISLVGVRKLIVQLWKTLIGNEPMQGETFPVLNFAIALLCCWAFNVTVMSYIFNGLAEFQKSNPSWLQSHIARWIDYFGTASVTYLGSDQFFKKVIAVKQSSEELLSQVKTDDKTDKGTTQ
jgi:hypothetical protein